MPEILVIVVTFNAMRWLERCLGSIGRSEPPADALVIDNGSTDGTPEAVRRQFPWARLVETGENLGFGAANNIGLREALSGGYKFAYLLNQDAWLQADTLSKLTAAHTGGYGILSPLQKDAQGRLDRNFQRKCGRFLYEYADSCRRSVVPPNSLKSKWMSPAANDPDQRCGREAGKSGSLSMAEGIVPVPFVMAAHWLLSREAIETVGGFSPSFKHYGEDDNFIDRLHFHGLLCGVVTSASAVHDRGDRQPPKETRMRLKCTAAVVKVSKPVGCFLLRFILEIFELVGMSVKNLSPRPLLFIPTFLGKLPGLRRDRETSRKKGAFL